MRIGTSVEWTSSANGKTQRKVGKIAERVPAGHFPTCTRLGRESMHRDHVSYVVRASVEGRKGTRLYWPRVSALKEVQP